MLSGPGGLGATATLSVVLVYMFMGGCLDLFVVGRVCRLPPGPQSVDSNV